MNGFVGVGMMNMASGGMIGGAANTAMNGQGTVAAQAYDPYANQAAQQLNQAQTVAQAHPVTPVQAAPQAQTGATGSFCPNCGQPTNGANFCSNCGTKLK